MSGYYGPLHWQVRGVGTSGPIPDLLTGQTHDSLPDIAGFVPSMEDAEALLEMISAVAGCRGVRKDPSWGIPKETGSFVVRAKITHRDSDDGPYHIQVKVGCVDVDVLTRLYDAVSMADNVLRPESLLWAIDPVASPGYKPIVMRMYDELKESALLPALMAWKEQKRKNREIADHRSQLVSLVLPLLESKAIDSPQLDSYVRYLNKLIEREWRKDSVK